MSLSYLAYRKVDYLGKASDFLVSICDESHDFLYVLILLSLFYKLFYDHSYIFYVSPIAIRCPIFVTKHCLRLPNIVVHCLTLPWVSKLCLRLTWAIIAQHYPRLPNIAIHHPALPQVALDCFSLPNVALGCQTLPSIAQHFLRFPKGSFHCPRLPDIAIHHPTMPQVAKHCHSWPNAQHCIGSPKVAKHCPMLPFIDSVIVCFARQHERKTKMKLKAREN